MTAEKDKYTIAALRRKKRLSQRSVAADLGVSLGVYRGWERDLSNACITDAIALARYYGIGLGELLLRK